MRLPFRKVWLLLLLLPVFFTACNGIVGFPTGGGTTSSGPQSGVYTLNVGQQQGSGWYIYSANNVPDPLAAYQRTGAIITLVTNNSGYDLSLAHGRVGSQFVYIPAGTTVTNFNGLLVEGDWTAEIRGNQADAPSGFSLQVAWKAP